MTNGKIAWLGFTCNNQFGTKPSAVISTAQGSWQANQAYNLVTSEYDDCNVYEQTGDNTFNWTNYDAYVAWANGIPNGSHRIYWDGIGGPSANYWYTGLSASAALNGWANACQAMKARTPASVTIYVNTVNEIFSRSIGATGGQWPFLNAITRTTSPSQAQINSAMVQIHTTARNNLSPNFKIGFNDWGTLCNVGFPGSYHNVVSQSQSLGSALYNAGLLDWIGEEGYQLDSTPTATVQAGLNSWHSLCPNAEYHLTEFSPASSSGSYSGGAAVAFNGVQSVLATWQRYISIFQGAANGFGINGPWWLKASAVGGISSNYGDSCTINDSVTPNQQQPFFAWFVANKSSFLAPASGGGGSPAPTISSISPTQGKVAGGETINIVGANFN